MGRLYSFITIAAISVQLVYFHASLSLASIDVHHRVNMRMIYRAFCPACQWFIESPLLEIMRTEDYRNIIDLTLIPAAGMRVKKDGKITCEGGILECTGHRWMICVLDKDRDDVVKYLGTIACIEGDESGQVGDWSTKMNNCVTDKERVVVEECFENRSNDLLVKLIQQELSGNLPWMPYTLVNQKALGTATEGISLNMLKTSICSAYTGPKSFYPAECVKFVGEQKLFAAEDTVENKGEKTLVAAKGKFQAATVLAEKVVDAKAMPPAPVGGDGGRVVETAPEPLRVRTTTGVSDKVRMELYWRAFCSGCMSFITKSLLSLVRNKGFQEIIDFHPVPAAGTYYDAEGNVHCAAGRVECAGHKWLSCVVDEFQQMGELVEYIACMESKDNKGMTWSFVINRCFKSEALTKMKTCYKSKSEELLRKNVVKKQALRIPWVPYVLLNGVPLGDARHGIGFQQLMDAVCKAYSGPLSLWSTPCQPKRLRDEAQLMPPAEEAVKPCVSKEKDANAGAQYEDAPGIGKPLYSESEAKTVTEFKAKVVGDKQVGDKESSITITAVILPGVCFVALVVVAFRFTRDHKKNA